MASDHDDLELNQVLTFKEDAHSLAHGESETINGSWTAGSTTMHHHHDHDGAGDGFGGRGRTGRGFGDGSAFGSSTRAGLRRWADSFRRDPKGRMTPQNAFVGGLALLPGLEEPGGERDDDGGGGGDGGWFGFHRRQQHGRNYYDLRAANYRTANPLLAKELKGRHLQMIAIGGSIGEFFPSSSIVQSVGGRGCLLFVCVVEKALLVGGAPGYIYMHDWPER